MTTTTENNTIAAIAMNSKSNKPLKVTVVGASGGSGRHTVNALLQAGHQVTALSRKASMAFAATAEANKNLRCIDGSAMNLDTLRSAIKGQDAVIVTLGISENPFRVRLLGPARTPMNIRSRGTELVIQAMQELGVRRLLVQTSYGSGPSRNLLRPVDQLFFSLLLKPQIADTEFQDELVRQSGLDWTITQPVHLNDATDVSASGTVVANDEAQVCDWAISRKQVGEYTASAIADVATIGKTMALSTVSDAGKLKRCAC